MEGHIISLEKRQLKKDVIAPFKNITQKKVKSSFPIVPKGRSWNNRCI